MKFFFLNVEILKIIHDLAHIPPVCQMRASTEAGQGSFGSYVTVTTETAPKPSEAMTLSKTNRFGLIGLMIPIEKSFYLIF